MPKGTRKNKTPKSVEAITHDDAKRKNIPTAEFESVMRKDEKTPIQLAYERRNRDLDPQLVWRGKDEQDWSDLIVHAPPLYVQEKVHPKVLIDDLKKQTEEQEKSEEETEQVDLFGDFNAVKPIIDEIDSYFGLHYGFTHAELDFIINYDIKYRMGKELESEGNDA